MSALHEESVALLSLFFAPGAGAVAQRRLLERYGSGQKTLAVVEEWRGEKGLQDIPKAIQDKAFQEKVKAELEWLVQNDARVISLFDSVYPPLLKKAHQAHPILFFKGSFQSWEGKIPLAFVGSRTPSDYGRKVVEALMEGLASLPIVIVSGFASGVDTFAHEAALANGLETIGVLGNGLDTVYPKENKSLANSLVRKGGLMTQFPIGTEPNPWNFPSRNRIIAGASRATIVIEAREKSGSLITAQLALEEGRDVMAVPGSIFSMKNRGCHRLIQQGAKLVNGVEDILEELKLAVSSMGPKESKKTTEIPLEGNEEIIFRTLRDEPLHIDKLTEISNLPASSVAGVLTTLTLKGLIEELPGKYYVRS